MQKIIITFLQLVFRALESLAPVLSNRLALWFFFRPVRMARPDREIPVIDLARTTQRPIEGFYPRSPDSRFYQAYEWGHGPPVLLVHGWGGRASQFHGMIPRLVENGYKVVAFDAPAHGDSPGSRTNLLEFGEILRDLSQVYGEFQGIVAHSFGAVASIRALVLDRLPSLGLTVVGAPANLDFILEGFSRQLQVTERSLESIKSCLNELATQDREEFSLLTHLPHLSQPLLIVHDELDRSVEIGQGEKIALAKPDSSFLKTKGLGHNRILSDLLVVDKVLEFVSECGIGNRVNEVVENP